MEILFWIFHMGRMIQYITFCASLLVLTMMFSRFIDVAACVSSSFLFMAAYPIGCIYHSLFIPWSADRHLDCFYLLLVVNSAPMNIREHVFVWVPLFSSFGYTIKSGISVSFAKSMFTFWGKSSCFYSSCIILHSHKQCRRRPFSLYPYQHLFFFSFIFLSLLLLAFFFIFFNF